MTISLVVILGIAVGVLIKTKKLGWAGAITATLFGVFLAATALGPSVQRIARQAADAMADAARTFG